MPQPSPQIFLTPSEVCLPSKWSFRLPGPRLAMTEGIDFSHVCAMSSTSRRVVNNNIPSMFASSEDIDVTAVKQCLDVRRP